ncbi:hypothetical protein [Nocardia colli]|uniref:hypothetical protein n=1 Tax=Nocardia colli TaxID=2545717 RepID=UPI0035E2E28F
MAAHPGLSDTEFTRTGPAARRLPLTWLAPLIMQTPAMGALLTLRAVLGGQYCEPADATRSRVTPAGHFQYEVAVQQRLWAVSEDLTGMKFPVVRAEQNSFPSGSARTRKPALTGDRTHAMREMR